MDAKYDEQDARSADVQRASETPRGQRLIRHVVIVHERDPWKFLRDLFGGLLFP